MELNGKCRTCATESAKPAAMSSAEEEVELDALLYWYLGII
ncbi:hypothetical protein BMS3Bbin16_00648 [archaeon BMS3Bbin16]|nr:hypothetical protein BMS3Bbin16_00648 [archaeon BMS3Bbin16]